MKNVRCYYTKVKFLNKKKNHRFTPFYGSTQNKLYSDPALALPYLISLYINTFAHYYRGILHGNPYHNQY